MALARLESLNFESANLDLDGYIDDYNLFNTANQLYSSERSFQKHNPSERKSDIL